MADKTLAFLKNWGPSAVYVLTIVFGFGVTYAEIQDLKRRAAAQEADHDVLIRVDENVKTMKEDMKKLGGK